MDDKMKCDKIVLYHLCYYLVHALIVVLMYLDCLLNTAADSHHCLCSL